ncbi:hypothetical protein CDAR_237841 [Caerostris darwini]|uniref:Uncharacterized protein n=1 Tax=Caerostris darwini TaxID=1538125 RepID=A0AAV4S0M0_9ARAC|nr:hypothetical protein CDAR_237841 [Caerostris darwini]
MSRPLLASFSVQCINSNSPCTLEVNISALLLLLNKINVANSATPLSSTLPLSGKRLPLLIVGIHYFKLVSREFPREAGGGRLLRNFKLLRVKNMFHVIWNGEASRIRFMPLRFMVSIRGG